MTAASWKSGSTVPFTIPDDAGGDELFEFRKDGDGTGGTTTPPPFDDHSLKDLFGRIEDLLSHTVPADVLQAIHDAFQNVIDHLPHIDPPPNLPDLGHLWPGNWTQFFPSEIHEPVSHSAADNPGNPGVDNGITSKLPVTDGDPGHAAPPTPPWFEPHGSLSGLADLSHSWWQLT